MEFVVSDAAFRRLWSWCGLGDTPVVLQLVPTAFTEQEQDAERDRADAELAQQGLVRRGWADADVEALLRILRRPRFATDARLLLDGSVRALAGSQGGAGAVAVRAEGWVRVRALCPPELAQAVIGLLPEHPAGPGDPASVAREDINAAAELAGADTGRFEAELIARRVAPAKAAMFAGLAAAAFRRGQFGAAVVNVRGMRHYSPEVVNFADTPDGRYQLRGSGPAGNGRLTVAPITTDQLAVEVAAMLDRLDPT